MCVGGYGNLDLLKISLALLTVIYLCHPWIIFAVGSLEHFGIACNGWVKVVISMIMSICTAFLVVKMSNKFKIIRKFI